MQTDEDKMIKKLEEHRDTIKLVEDIGKLHGIQIKATTDNESKGDFIYPKNREKDLIQLLDKYLGKYRYAKDNDGR